MQISFQPEVSIRRQQINVNLGEAVRTCFGTTVGLLCSLECSLVTQMFLLRFFSFSAWIQKEKIISSDM